MNNKGSKSKQQIDHIISVIAQLQKSQIFNYSRLRKKQSIKKFIQPVLTNCCYHMNNRQHRRHRWIQKLVKNNKSKKKYKTIKEKKIKSRDTFLQAIKSNLQMISLLNKLLLQIQKVKDKKKTQIHQKRMRFYFQVAQAFQTNCNEYAIKFSQLLISHIISLKIFK